jgi:DnaK suppressor protein
LEICFIIPPDLVIEIESIVHGQLALWPVAIHKACCLKSVGFYLSHGTCFYGFSGPNMALVWIGITTEEVDMPGVPNDVLRAQLTAKKEELSERLQRITANLQRGFDADSKEMAKELEDSEVVDALGNEARTEIAKISAALIRMDNGRYGTCVACAEPIDVARIEAYPYADECIDCARIDERREARS